MSIMDLKDIEISQSQLIIVLLLIIIPLLYELWPGFRYNLKMLLVYSWYFGQAVIFFPILLFYWRNVSNMIVMAHALRPLGNLLGIKYMISGTEILEKEEPCIYVCNHQSSLDLIGMANLWPHIKRCAVVAKKELMYAGSFGMMCWLCNTVFINRLKSEESRNVLNKQIADLKKNKIKLWIFPEGTRNHSHSMLPFKKGAFHLAIQAQIPIVPVVFSSYSHFYDKNTVKFKSGGTISIKVLKPVVTAGATAADIPRICETVRNNMIEAFNECSEDFNGSDSPYSNANGLKDN